MICVSHCVVCFSHMTIRMRDSITLSHERARAEFSKRLEAVEALVERLTKVGGSVGWDLGAVGGGCGQRAGVQQSRGV